VALHLHEENRIGTDRRPGPSDNKENTAATWKKAFGFHPLLAFLNRPDIAAGEAFGRASKTLCRLDCQPSLC
jgi:hypothetical protein